MKTIISLESHPSSDHVEERSNEQDPKHLKKALTNLIEKSKNMIATLEQTLAKLEKSQLEKDFWKNHYFQFRDSCHKYIEAKGLQPFEYISNLEQQVKNLTVHKKCIEESRLTFNSRFQANFSPQATYKRKGPGNKSISTISFMKENQHSAHKIKPKKINIFRRSDKKPQ